MQFPKNHHTAQLSAATASGPLESYTDIIGDLRRRCPLPLLMKQMGYAKFTKRTCCSPLRPDKSPSWGIFQRDDRWFWKDHGNGESGDEIEFIIGALKLQPLNRFERAIDQWSRMAAKVSAPEEVAVLPTNRDEPREKPDRSRFGPGTDAQLERLSQLRRIDPLGVVLAQMQGVLVFGCLGLHEVYGVTDSTGYVLEVRRLDGEPFPAWGSLNERKCHSVKGSRKDWPVGLGELGSRTSILLVEGGPDLIAAFEVIAREEAQNRVCPVAMLSAGAAISTDALPLFKGKTVRIVPHDDKAGRTAAVRWKKQLVDAGATKVEFLLPSADKEGQTSPVKDLNDYLPIYRNDLAGNPNGGRIL